MLINSTNYLLSAIICEHKKKCYANWAFTWFTGFMTINTISADFVPTYSCHFWFVICNQYSFEISNIMLDSKIIYHKYVSSCSYVLYKLLWNLTYTIHNWTELWKQVLWFYNNVCLCSGTLRVTLAPLKYSPCILCDNTSSKWNFCSDNFCVKYKRTCQPWKINI